MKDFTTDDSKGGAASADESKDNNDTTPPNEEGGGNDEGMTEAKEIMDGIADQPMVCEALYEMLKAKYETATNEKDVPNKFDDSGMEE